MSAPQKSSRWGNFLSQAVAGVEARLDNILAEEDGTKASSSSTNPVVAPGTSPAPSTSATRPATTAKSANDRLQERLARAVAAKSAGASARPSIEAASTGGSPRPSLDIPQPTPASATQTASPRASLSVEETTTSTSHAPVDPSEVISATTADNPAAPSPRSSLQIEPVPTETSAQHNAQHEVESHEEVQLTSSDAAASDIYQERVAHLERTLEEIQSQNQEELHNQAERVDALQTKLEYLAKEASEQARAVAANAPAGSSDKKIAEKNDQIAQLMLEGQKLAATEGNYRSVIKRLRVQLVANDKELNEQKVWRQKAEKEIADLRRRVDESNSLEKANEESYKLLSQSKRELDRLKIEIEAKDRSIADLKGQLQEESEKATLLAARKDDHQREALQKRVKELEDTVAALEVEKNLATDRGKSQVAEAREKADKASAHAQAIELELKGEVQMLESKLEALRAKAEEASSGAGGESQVKLLRQIETLQTQYSVASENWQGMEASLEAKAANLEKERDEALRRESEMRKKARETASRARRQEEELEEMRNQLPTVERDLQSYQSELDALKTKAGQTEAALADTKAELAKHQALLKNDKGDRTDFDRRNWLDDVPSAAFRDRGRPDSPSLTAPQRTFSGDTFLGLQNYSSRFRKTSAPSSNGEPSPSDRPSSIRRPSVQPPARSPLFPSASGLPIATTPSMTGGFDFAAPTPLRATDREDMLEGLERSASPQNVLQDLASVSTMTAGPSVQLVERMSAAIRRLESEKVAGKEELARISSQRDDARGEIVTLIRELDTTKAAAKRVADLEKEVAEINERYQTTLEMLGEKSELVEELRADVQDVKAMYRDLVERTVK